MKIRALVVLLSTSAVVMGGMTVPAHGDNVQQQEGGAEQHVVTELEKVQRTEYSSVAPLQDVAPTQLSAESQAMKHNASRSAVTVQKDPKGGVSLDSKKPGGSSIHVGLPYAERASDASAVTQGAVSYDNKNGSSTIPVAKNDGSLQMVTKIDRRDAPTEYKYVMGVPQGAKLVQQEDGSVLVLGQDGKIISVVSKPWAVDAQGTPVDTKYVVKGNELIQVIDHTSQDYKYPIVADPWMGLDLIERAWWNDADSPWWDTVVTPSEPRYVVHVIPTRLGRELSQQMFYLNHVNELKEKLGDDAWRVDDHDGTIREQFFCHVNLNGFESETYDMESWLPSIPWKQQANPTDKCNPGEGRTPDDGY